MSTLTQTTIRSLIVLSILSVLCSCTREPGPEQAANTADDVKEQAQQEPLSAVVQCDAGTFVIRLRPDLAPLSVANFCNLVDRGFYHGKEVANANTVSKSIGYVKSAPSYRLPPEYSSEIFFNKAGIVAWTYVDTKAATEQFIPNPTRFFITIKPQERWNLQYSPFGTIEKGQDVVDRLQKGDWISSVRIVGDPTWLMERYGDRVNEWDNALDQAGYFRAGSEDTQFPPVNSN